MAQESTTSLDTILDLKRRDPFAPFTVVMTGGDRCLIEDPDALAIATTQLHYYPRSGKGIHMQIREIAVVERFGQKQSA